jgi:homogentisate 1,2-dioxygenase
MLDRIAVGEIPRKHHIVFRDAAGALRHEECLTRDGFDGPYTIAYHTHRPHTHRVAELRHGFAPPRATESHHLAKRHFKTQDLTPLRGAPVDVRVPLLFNDDVCVSVVHPDREDPVYFSNADGDELYYIFKGSGLLRTPLGDLRYNADDYVAVPRGISYRFVPDADVEQYWVVFEFSGSLHLPRQWRNETGQLRMDAPYCHRDFRRPEFRGPLDEGIRELLVKRNGSFHGFALEHSPLDVVGWDGTVYPWVFPILNFQARAGLVHLPPTWHGTFAARGALICSFVPRAVDFHPEAIPCPYPHSSFDCDEMIFYCRGNFTSRRGVGPGSVSYHPAGIPHGPHPGAYEASIGHRETSELAVMMDSFKALTPTTYALKVEDPAYQHSFIG